MIFATSRPFNEHGLAYRSGSWVRFLLRVYIYLWHAYNIVESYEVGWSARILDCRLPVTFAPQWVGIYRKPEGCLLNQAFIYNLQYVRSYGAYVYQGMIGFLFLVLIVARSTMDGSGGFSNLEQAIDSDVMILDLWRQIYSRYCNDLTSLKADLFPILYDLTSLKADIFQILYDLTSLKADLFPILYDLRSLKADIFPIL